MTDPRSEIAAAIVPAHPLGDVNAPIVLHEGQVDGYRDGSVEGRFELSCARGLDLAWSVNDDEGPWRRRGLEDLELVVTRPEGCIRLAAHRQRADAGWFDPVMVGSSVTELDRVVVTWFNLSQIRSPEVIRSLDGRSVFTGRWTAEIAGWAMIVDRRHDHAEVWRQAREDGGIVATHVMEIRRLDGDTFTPDDVEPFLDALHVGLSFALGRWVAPAVPVGFDRSGRRVWEQWGNRQCARGGGGVPRWWFDQHVDDLADLLTCAAHMFAAPESAFSTRFLMSSAVQSAATGFVEQRIMTAAAAIEHLTWVRLRLTEVLSGSEYDGLRAHGRLRRLLDDANIPTTIDAELLPAVHRFTAAEQEPVRDAPEAATRVRNKIVHPKSLPEGLYRHDGLVRETWFLTHQYLVLLTLHHIGFSGSFQQMLRPGGRSGVVQPVPWTGEDG
ncbi:MAG: hypothetical protein ACRDRH_04155 [Pseudonocardia sp.]